MIALVVLGCRSSGRRSEAAATAFHAFPGQFACVVASGGRAWASEPDGQAVVEADVLAADLVRRGVPEKVVVRERCSHSTRENALYCRSILGRWKIDTVTIVSTDWHLPRATGHFQNVGFDVTAVGVPSRLEDPFARLMVRIHEAAATALDRMVR
ncbi:MAG: YdcF family protein [Polyangiaceae bacterium]